MRFNQIVETTTAGSVATVAQPMMTQTRESVDVKGLKPVKQLMKGKSKNKGPYANSIAESKVTEDDLAEQDLIVIPGQGRLRKTGLVKHDMDQGEHEGHTLKNSLHTIIRVATDLDKRLSVQSEFPEWVSEKIGATKSMMVTVMDYLISSQEMQHDSNAMNEGSQRVDSLVTDALKRMKGPEVSDAVLALKRVLGDRAYNERRGFYSFYVDQIVDMYGQQGVEEGRVAQLPTQGADYSKYDTDHLKMMLRPGILHRNEARFKALIRKELQKREQQSQQGVAEGFADQGSGSTAKDNAEYMKRRNGSKIDFAKKLQKNVNKHNKAIVKTKQAVGSRISDIGAGGKEYNVKTDAAWDAAKKKVSEGSKK